VGFNGVTEKDRKHLLAVKLEVDLIVFDENRAWREKFCFLSFLKHNGRSFCLF